MPPVVYIILGVILLLIILYICFKKQINFFVVAITSEKRIQKKLYKACKANDYLILNDIYLPIGNNKYKHIDTIIFGNKYIYIIKEIKQVGQLLISLNDQKWRVVDKGLTLINNPLLSNRRVISCLTQIVDNLERKDLKSIVIVTKNCTFDKNINTKDEFVVSETNAIKLINDIEKKSNEDIIDPNELERFCKAFYQEGLKAEKEIKAAKKKNNI